MKLEETIKIRANSEGEAQNVIDGYKKGQQNGYTLKKAGYEKKQKKAKGEVIDEAYVVTVTLVYCGIWEAE